MKPGARASEGTAARIVLAVWIACFLIGTFTHTRHLIEHGWLPYRFAALPFNLFWTMLTFIDPLVAILLVLRGRAGIILGLIVMIADVAVNTWIAAAYGLSGVAGPLQAQTLFLGFTLGSFRLIWPGGGRVPPAGVAD